MLNATIILYMYFCCNSKQLMALAGFFIGRVNEIFYLCDPFAFKRYHFGMSLQWYPDIIVSYVLSK